MNISEAKNKYYDRSFFSVSLSDLDEKQHY